MDEVHDFLNELIDEFGAEGTISHDTFNKAVTVRVFDVGCTKTN